MTATIIHHPNFAPAPSGSEPTPTDTDQVYEAVADIVAAFARLKGIKQGVKATTRWPRGEQSFTTMGMTVMMDHIRALAEYESWQAREFALGTGRTGPIPRPPGATARELVE